MVIIDVWGCTGELENPADHVLDLISPPATAINLDEMLEEGRVSPGVGFDGVVEAAVIAEAEAAAAKDHAAPVGALENGESGEEGGGGRIVDAATGGAFTYRTPQWWQIWTVIKKSMLFKLREPLVFMTQFATAVIVGLLLGSLYWNLDLGQGYA